MPSPLTPTSDRTRSVLTPRDRQGGRGASCAVLPAAAASLPAHREKAKKAFHPDGRSERPPHETSGPPNGCVFLSDPVFPHAYHIVLHGFHHPALNAIDSPMSPGMGNPVRGLYVATYVD
jgi:hypothetical protein